MQIPLISATFAQSIPNICSTHGRNPLRIFETVGVDMNVLNNPNAFIQLDGFNDLLQHCSQKLNMPHFGLLAGSTLSPQMLGAFGLRLHYSQTIGSGLEFLQEHFPRVQHATDINIIKSGRTYILKTILRNHDLIGTDHLIEVQLSLLVGWIRRCYRARWEPIKIYLRRKSAAVIATIKKHFRCPVITNSSFDGLEFTQESYDGNLKHSDPALCAVLEDYLENQTVTSLKNPDLSATVQHAITKGLEDQRFKIEQVASDIGLSVRTLQRKLDQKGIKFSELVEAARFSVARQLLRHQEISISDIAYRTGYSDTSSFSRAFQRWQGMSPRQFR